MGRINLMLHICRSKVFVGKSACFFSDWQCPFDVDFADHELKTELVLWTDRVIVFSSSCQTLFAVGMDDHCLDFNWSKKYNAFAITSLSHSPFLCFQVVFETVHYIERANEKRELEEMENQTLAQYPSA